MKRFYLPAAAAALAIVVAAPATAADNMKGMAMPAAESAKTGNASGVVTAVDRKAGAVTIKHGPIPAVGWPAMTMTFKATTPALLKGVKAGDKVDFTVKVQGQDNQVTALHRK